MRWDYNSSLDLSTNFIGLGKAKSLPSSLGPKWPLSFNFTCLRWPLSYTLTHLIWPYSRPIISTMKKDILYSPEIWQCRKFLMMYKTNINVNNICSVNHILCKVEVAQGVPGGLRPRIFLTFRHYNGGRSSTKRTGRLYPRRNPWYSLSEAESTSGHMVLSGEPWKKSPVTPPRIDPGTFRLVAQCLEISDTVIPRLTKIIRSGITFVSRNFSLSRT